MFCSMCKVSNNFYFSLHSHNLFAVSGLVPGIRENIADTDTKPILMASADTRCRYQSQPTNDTSQNKFCMCSESEENPVIILK